MKQRKRRECERGRTRTHGDGDGVETGEERHCAGRRRGFRWFGLDQEIGLLRDPTLIYGNCYFHPYLFSPKTLKSRTRLFLHISALIVELLLFYEKLGVS